MNRYLALLITALLLLLAGCSPIYQTQYTYHPIAGRTGQACSNQCESAKQTCRQLAQQITMQCQSQSQLTYQLCMNGRTMAYNKKGEVECVANCYCPEPDCGSPDFSGCEEQFKECYLNCGGEVTAATVCTNFCDKAAPPSIQKLKKLNDGSVVDMNSPSYQATSKKSSSKKQKDLSSDLEYEMQKLNQQMKQKTATEED